jgi:hypothetical protein
MIFGGGVAEYVQAILATIQFRMLHVLIVKPDIVPVILCGCEIWSVMSREENRLRESESRVVKRKFDVRGRKEQKDAEDSVNFMIVTLHQIIINIIGRRKIIHVSVFGMWHACSKEEGNTEFA